MIKIQFVFLQCVGNEVVEEDITLCNQFMQYFLAAAGFEIDGDGFLVSVTNQ